MTAGPPLVPTDLLDRAGIGVALVDEQLRYHHVNAQLAALNGRLVEEHLGRTIADVLPALAPVIEPLVRRALDGEPAVTATVKGSTPATAAGEWEARFLPVKLPGGRPGVGVLVVDVTDRRDAVAETRRRLRQQAALATLGQQALGGAALDEVLQATTDVLHRELEPDYAGVLQFAADRGELWMRAGTGFPDGAVGRMTAAVGDGSQAGFTLLQDDAVVTVDALHEDRFTFSQGLLDLGVRSAMSVPIPGPDQPFGVLGVLAVRPGAFNEDDANVLRGAANILGATVLRDHQDRTLEELAAQRGRLVAQALDASEVEQRRVADVLHDEVLQHLLFARLELRGLDLAPEAAERVHTSIEQATALLRRVIGGLHPVTLSHAGLGTAVESLAAEFRARAGLDLDVYVSGDVPREHDRLVLSLVRELLSNVVKHAGATRALVRVLDGPEAVVVHVGDDGRGLAADAFEAALGRGNIGLANARERVAALSGTIHVGPGLDGRGAGVTIRLPR